MDCNGYVEGFDSFGVETMHKLCHTALEMEGKLQCIIMGFVYH